MTPSDNADDIVRAIVQLLTTTDELVEAYDGEQQPIDDHFAATEPGQLLGTLDADEATRFAQLAVDVTKDRYVVSFDDTGALRLNAVV